MALKIYYDKDADVNNLIRKKFYKISICKKKEINLF